MTDPTVVPEAPPASAPAQPTIRSRAEIAREMFGKEYFEPVKPPVEEIIEEAKPADAQAGEEPPQGEPTESGEPKEGETAPAPEEATDEMPIATVAELVEHLEAKPEWFNGLKMSFNVDGMPTEATIKDLVDSYQLRGAAEHRLEKAKEFAQKQAEALTAKYAEADRTLVDLGALVQHEEQQLESAIKAIDPRLRDEDPAEWSARITEFSQKRAHIAQVKAEARAKWQANQEGRDAEAHAIRDHIKAEQAQLLLQRLPEWQDEKTADAEKAQIADYLMHSGFQPQDLDNLLDHRQVMIARKAMLYDQSRGQVDTAKKRVATVPKIMKASAPKAREQIASERLAALHAKMVKSGHPDDALAYTRAKREMRK